MSDERKRISRRTAMAKCCLSSMVYTWLEHIFAVDLHKRRNKERKSYDRSVTTLVFSPLSLPSSVVRTSDHLPMSIDWSMWMFSKSRRYSSISFGWWNSRFSQLGLGRVRARFFWYAHLRWNNTFETFCPHCCTLLSKEDQTMAVILRCRRCGFSPEQYWTNTFGLPYFSASKLELDRQGERYCHSSLECVNTHEWSEHQSNLSARNHSWPTHSISRGVIVIGGYWMGHNRMGKPFPPTASSASGTGRHQQSRIEMSHDDYR